MSIHVMSALETSARFQEGCFTVRQAAAAGLTRRQLTDLTRRGLLQRLQPDVYAFPGGDGEGRMLWSASLQLPDAVAGFGAAGRVLGLSATPPGEAAMIVSRGRHAVVRGIRLHQSAFLPADHVTDVGGLPVTTPYRTVVDLSPRMSGEALRKLTIECVTRRGASLAGLGAVLGETRRRGRPGGPALAAVLDDLAGAPVPRTVLESMLDASLASVGLSHALAEYPLPSDGSMSGFVDRCFPEVKLIVEADGRRWHERYEAMERDRLRDRQAARRGFLTLRVMYEELKVGPGKVGQEILDVYRERCQGNSAA